MKIWRLGSFVNFVGKREELVFDAFSDPEPVCHTDHRHLCTVRCVQGSASRGSVSTAETCFT